MLRISHCKSRFSSVFSRLLVILCISAFSLNAFGVTEAEMDQARAIAAKWYLRYINSGADYLNKLNPKSMKDLEGNLNAKEKENIKKFNAIAAPSGYESWNKDDLVKYWSATFFNNNSSKLDPALGSGDFVKGKVKGEIQAEVKVSSNSASATQAKTDEVAPTAPSDAAETAAQEGAAADAETEQALAEIENADMQPVVAPAAPEQAPEKKSSGTWVYVMVLCILVGIVIVLVVYASKTMKGQPAAKAAARSDDDYAPRQKSSLTDETRMREKFAETLAAKSEEIRTLNRKIADLENANQKLKEENRKLKAAADNSRFQRPQREVAAEPAAPASAPRPARPKEIYLGRANAKGLFVRADRHAVEGQSIFKLKTTDGVNGTFAVIPNPLTEEQAIEDPGKWLAGGCFAKDIFDTAGKRSVITETPGLAIFEDGAWRVERKAKIRYE